MIKQIFLPLVGVAVFVILVGLFVKNSGNFKFTQSAPEKKTLTIGTKSISIEIAKTPESRAKGLSGRTVLADDSGMFFVFDHQDIIPSFWMKDMLIPLDFVWINDGKIVKIDKNVQAPQKGTSDNKLPTYSAGTPIDYVLEVSGGFADKNNIKVNDSVVLPAL